MRHWRSQSGERLARMSWTRRMRVLCSTARIVRFQMNLSSSMSRKPQCERRWLLHMRQLMGQLPVRSVRRDVGKRLRS